MKRVNIVLSLLLAVIFFSACKKDSTTTPAATIVNFAATINGASETPANASTATGSATGSYNKTTKILTLTVTYTGITVTAAHIHRGDVGVPGGVEFPLPTTASPISYTSPAFDATQENDLMENKYYVNLHSAAFGGGEIRGQLNKQ